MDIQHNYTEADAHSLANKFLKLSINSATTYSQCKRQSNTLIPAKMPFETNIQLIQQYNALYLGRLAQLAKRFSFKTVYKIEDAEGRLGAINLIGIFKRIELRRVRAFQKGYDEYYGGNRRIYDDKDGLQLEDASGKLNFILMPGATMNGHAIKPTDLPFGVIIGLTGTYCDQKMHFKTTKITLPQLAPQKPFINQVYAHPRKTLITSALSIPQIKSVLRQICCNEHMNHYSQIKSIVFIGFSQKFLSQQYKQLDSVFEKYQDSIDIFLMPNINVAEVYPQKPLHPILFRKSYKKLNLVCNPQIFWPNSEDLHPEQIQEQNLSGSILMCSGQNIKDFAKNCQFGNSSLDAMQAMLQYSHLSPSSPFSLKCEMMKQDFLIVKELPHVFIAADCQKTEVRDFVAEDKKVRLVSIKTGQMILLDIDNHDIQEYVMANGIKLMEMI